MLLPALISSEKLTSNTSTDPWLSVRIAVSLLTWMQLNVTLKGASQFSFVDFEKTSCGNYKELFNELLHEKM